MQPVKIPPVPLNGGLYTGATFLKDAPWANVPYIPDADWMTNEGLRSANPPPEALTQYQGGFRPGNNYQQMPGVSDMQGVSCNKPLVQNNTQNPRFSKYFYY
jgi:hypothetical protein